MSFAWPLDNCRCGFVVDPWFLVLGYWIFDSGSLVVHSVVLLVLGSWSSDLGYWMLDKRSLAPGACRLVIGRWFAILCFV